MHSEPQNLNFHQNLNFYTLYFLLWFNIFSVLCMWNQKIIRGYIINNITVSQNWPLIYKNIALCMLIQCTSHILWIFVRHSGKEQCIVFKMSKNIGIKHFSCWYLLWPLHQVLGNPFLSVSNSATELRPLLHLLPGMQPVCHYRCCSIPSE